MPASGRGSFPIAPPGRARPSCCLPPLQRQPSVAVVGPSGMRPRRAVVWSNPNAGTATGGGAWRARMCVWVC